jgi:hypothetical protein
MMMVKHGIKSLHAHHCVAMWKLLLHLVTLKAQDGIKERFVQAVKINLKKLNLSILDLMFFGFRAFKQNTQLQIYNFLLPVKSKDTHLFIF